MYAENIQKGLRSSPWRAACIDAIAGELHDFSRSKRTTRQHAEQFVREAFELDPATEDREWRAVALTIQRAVRLDAPHLVHAHPTQEV